MHTIQSEAPLLPGEPNSSGHVTITHQMLSSTFRVFRAVSLPQPDKKRWENLCNTFKHIPISRKIYFSFI